MKFNTLLPKKNFSGWNFFMSRFLEKLEKELMDRAIMNQVKLTASLTNSSFPGAY